MFNRLRTNIKIWIPTIGLRVDIKCDFSYIGQWLNSSATRNGRITQTVSAEIYMKLLKCKWDETEYAQAQDKPFGHSKIAEIVPHSHNYLCEMYTYQMIFYLRTLLIRSAIPSLPWPCGLWSVAGWSWDERGFRCSRRRDQKGNGPQTTWSSKCSSSASLCKHRAELMQAQVIKEFDNQHECLCEDNLHWFGEIIRLQGNWSVHNLIKNRSKQKSFKSVHIRSISEEKKY